MAKKKRAVKKKKTAKRSAKKKTTRRSVKKKKVVRKKKATKKKKKVVRKKKTVKRSTKKKAKRSVKRKVAKKSVKKKAKKKTKKKRKPNPAFLRLLTASSSLAKVVGQTKITRQDAIKKVWAYVKRKGLQDHRDRRNINVDSHLSAIFGSKKQVSMFEVAKVISKNLKN